MTGESLVFTADGVLAPRDYDLSFQELRTSLLVLGPGGAQAPSWDGSWRRKLVDNLETLTKQLWTVGVLDVFVDGSFVEDKDHPNDIDGYFDATGFDLDALEDALNTLDPHHVWTWDYNRRRSVPGFAKPMLPMWIQYRVELYPHQGQSSGIPDEFGNELEFPAAFRKSRAAKGHQPRGVIKLRKRP
ncbi:MAG TPA: hypothetical protein VGR31_13140 [Planctomycetota bacterium]|jgi:hypothetical protein|nr:hypothetical protein [Planctomycetota bacterium]